MVFRIATNPSAIFSPDVAIDDWSTRENIRVLRKVFPSESTAGVSLRSSTVTNKSNPLTCTVASSFVCTSPLAVLTVTGVWETRIVSNSAEFKSFLPSMCIDAPESTTNSLPYVSPLDSSRTGLASTKLQEVRRR